VETWPGDLGTGLGEMADRKLEDFGSWSATLSGFPERRDELRLKLDPVELFGPFKPECSDDVTSEMGEIVRRFDKWMGTVGGPLFDPARKDDNPSESDPLRDRKLLVLDRFVGSITRGLSRGSGPERRVVLGTCSNSAGTGGTGGI